MTAPGLCPSSGTALVTVSLPKVTGSIPPHGSPCAPLLVQPGGLVTLLRGFGDPFWGVLVALSPCAVQRHRVPLLLALLPR